MSKVAEHYEKLLAEHYIWMFGVSFEQKVAEQKALVEGVLTSLPMPIRSGLAVDLGSGPGFQTIALAELGFSPVIALDTSRELLAHLEARQSSYAFEVRQADIRQFDSISLPGPATVVVCMGDTLTHLPSKTSVQKLFIDVFNKLAPGGCFILTYRDLTSELRGTDRFLPVHADDTRIMTCFLEYQSSDYVTVHDLVYVHGEGGWKLNKSSYEKLRLASGWVTATLKNAGFTITREDAAGRLLLTVAQK
jgi:SAM-dependent methyltransferase